jgi:hypothetical protein
MGSKKKDKRWLKLVPNTAKKQNEIKQNKIKLPITQERWLLLARIK